MIEAEGLTRYYGDFPAVRDASFTIDEREIVGFLGLNGAGKSTMLRILGGLLTPSAGRVRIGGLDASEAPDAMRKRIGFLPEDPPLYRDMRVGEFLLWVGQVKGRSRQEVSAALPEVMQTCQIDHVVEKVIGELSHGYRKRVGIAQAIIHRPDVVILDEPISGLDPQQIVEMRDVVRSLKERATVLLSSHILSEVAQTCDRVLVIHEGQIVAEGSETELGRTLGKGTHLSLVVRGEREVLEEGLDGSDIVSKYRLAERSDGYVNLDVTLSADEREALVAALVAAGIGIRSMQDAVSELERVFLELTREGRAPQSAIALGPSEEVRA